MGISTFFLYFQDEDSFLLKIVKLLYSICKARVNGEIDIILVWSYHTFIDSSCCFFQKYIVGFLKNVYVFLQHFLWFGWRTLDGMIRFGLTITVSVGEASGSTSWLYWHLSVLK